MDVRHLRRYVVEPTLAHLAHVDPGVDSQAAVELLLATAAHESGGFRWLHQVGGGPALGLWQVEPATYRDLWHRTIPSSPRWQEIGRSLWMLASMESVWAVDSEPLRIGGTMGNLRMPAPREMVGNLRFACAVARANYRRIPEPLPAAGDVVGQAGYYKRYWNTSAGAATTDDYVQAWHEYVRRSA